MINTQNLLIDFLYTKTGLETVKVNNILLHSKYDPIKEAKKVIEESFDEEKTNILFGFGLGYLYKEIQDTYDQEVIVIDPIFAHLSQHAIIQPKYVIDSVDKVKINRLLHRELEFYSRKINVICAPSYQKIFMEEYKETLNILKNVQHSNMISENTVRFFSEQWQINYVRNLSQLNKFDTFNKLINKFSAPIVIASGGPSLLKQIPNLKKYRKNFILMASGSTINSLIKEDIYPDFIVSVDGGEANYNHFKNLDIKNGNLIFSFSSHHKIQEEFAGNMYSFLLNDDHAFQKYIYNEFGINFPMLVGGTSVANFALSCAIHMTTGPISIIGQDLAYTNNQTHAKGNNHFKEIDKDYLIKKKAFKEKGYEGGEVWTDSLFVAMREEFEKLYDIYGEKKIIYNCTEGGLQIERIPQMNFEYFCKKYFKDPVELLELKEQINVAHHFSMRDFLQKELERYDLLIKEVKDVLLDLKMERNQNFFSNKLLKKLDKVDEKIKKIQEQSSINYILEPVLLDAVIQPQYKKEDTREIKFEKAYSQNEKLYNDIIAVLIKMKLIVNEII